MDFLTDRDISRFWGKIDVRGDDECWPWVAKARHHFGYGMLKVREHGNVSASRISCFLYHGEPPHEGAKCLHSCDNPSCCNPHHLRWGTQADNVKDAIDRKRNSPPPRVWDNPEWAEATINALPRGEGKINAKLTDEIVREIWNLHLSGLSTAEICKRTGAGKYPVADLCRGRTWRHLPDAPSLDELKKGGVRRGHNQFSRGEDTRALSPKTKIPSSEIPTILKRIKNGETYAAIGETYGVKKSAIWAIRKQNEAQT